MSTYMNFPLWFAEAEAVEYWQSADTRETQKVVCVYVGERQAAGLKVDEDWILSIK